MDINQTRKAIKEAMRGLPIPRALREDAMQVGFVAALEQQDIKAQIRQWLNSEYEFRDKLGTNEHISGSLTDSIIENPVNFHRRISKVNPQFTEPELIDGELVTYEEI